MCNAASRMLVRHILVVVGAVVPYDQYTSGRSRSSRGSNDSGDRSNCESNRDTTWPDLRATPAA